MANAVETFKVKAIERAQRAADEDEMLRRAAADERKSAMRRLADSFESAIGDYREFRVAGIEGP